MLAPSWVLTATVTASFEKDGDLLPMGSKTCLNTVNATPITITEFGTGSPLGVFLHELDELRT